MPTTRKSAKQTGEKAGAAVQEQVGAEETEKRRGAKKRTKTPKDYGKKT